MIIHSVQGLKVFLQKYLGDIDYLKSLALPEFIFLLETLYDLFSSQKIKVAQNNGLINENELLEHIFYFCCCLDPQRYMGLICFNFRRRIIEAILSLDGATIQEYIINLPQRLELESLDDSEQSYLFKNFEVEYLSLYNLYLQFIIQETAHPYDQFSVYLNKIIESDPQSYESYPLDQLILLENNLGEISQYLIKLENLLKLIIRDNPYLYINCTYYYLPFELQPSLLDRFKVEIKALL